MRKMKVLLVIVAVALLVLGCNLFRTTPKKTIENATKKVASANCYHVDAALQLKMRIGGDSVTSEEKSKLYYVKSPFEFYLENHKTDVKENKQAASVYYNYKKNKKVIYEKIGNDPCSKIPYSEKNVSKIGHRYLAPVELETFFSNASTFKEVKQENKNETCLHGTIQKEHVMKALEVAGVLHQIQLDALDQADCKKLESIVVDAYFDKESKRLTRIHMDMRRSFQNVVDALFNQKEKLYVIDSCILDLKVYKWDNGAIPVLKGMK